VEPCLTRGEAIRLLGPRLAKHDFAIAFGRTDVVAEPDAIVRDGGRIDEAPGHDVGQLDRTLLDACRAE
jgi:hypothetical protein